MRWRDREKRDSAWQSGTDKGSGRQHREDSEELHKESNLKHSWASVCKRPCRFGVGQRLEHTLRQVFYGLQQRRASYLQNTPPFFLSPSYTLTSSLFSFIISHFLSSSCLPSISKVPHMHYNPSFIVWREERSWPWNVLEAYWKHRRHHQLLVWAGYSLVDRIGISGRVWPCGDIPLICMSTNWNVVFIFSWKQKAAQRFAIG